MKTIHIKHFCRLPFLLCLLLLVTIPLLLWFLIAGIQENVPEMIAIGVLPLSAVLVGGGFLFHYGITITPKRVTVIYINALQSFRYEDVRYIEIGFDEESIWGEIKANGQMLTPHKAVI